VATNVSGDNGIGLLFQAGTVFGGGYADALSVNHIHATNNTAVRVDQGVAVASQGGTNALNVSDSVLEGDRLAYADQLIGRDSAGNIVNRCGGSLTINAENSRLFGHTAIAAAAQPASAAPRLIMNLANDSVWTLRPSQTAAVNGTRQSDVSVLNLRDSTIAFTPPAAGSNFQDADTWQTLVVGSGAPGTAAVYNASGNARIRRNALLNAGGDLSNQFTDRVLIHGDVSGTTFVTVNPVANEAFGAITSPAGDHKTTKALR